MVARLAGNEFNVALLQAAADTDWLAPGQLYGQVNKHSQAAHARHHSRMTRHWGSGPGSAAGSHIFFRFGRGHGVERTHGQSGVPVEAALRCYERDHPHIHGPWGRSPT